ncbi:hypothetical protein CkaCkLH20_04086 [Colletotrichum karsti]|uniref:Uncharacterized protein n=1 Tax=Colletotrichum karsti TaxID=1095194 RepID=A0A9P6LJQ0_9PEZI|nr:uncharacterized protein CkaCkLH20_04086 [Colletotrichum karsti]KAF9878594.1 hypothetical protein CkaCkLH20_04086 [Colletotrichum karsti]
MDTPKFDTASDSGYGSNSSIASGPFSNMSDQDSLNRLEETKERPVVLNTGRWPVKKKLLVINRSIPEAAINHLKDWKILYGQALWEFVTVSAPTHCNSKMAMKLRYLGASETESSLYLIFFCDKKIAKYVKRFVSRAHVQEDMRNHFVPQVISQSPELLRGDKVFCSAESFSEETCCGRRVYLLGTQHEQSRVGTLGGIVMAWSAKDIQAYGLTSGHLFTENAPPLSKEWSQKPLDDSDDDEWEDDIELDFDAVTITSDTSSSDLAAGQGNTFAENDGSFIPDEVFLLGTHQPVDPVLFGTPHKAGDWALVNIDDPMAVRPNIARGSADDTFPRMFLETLAEPHWGSSFDDCADVAVITCHKTLTGSLRQSGSTISVGPSAPFADMYDLSVANGALLPGDSGAWVVDAKSGDVYGHVIAIDALGEAYVAPMTDTLEEIRGALGADTVKLPTHHDVWEYKYKKGRNDIQDWGSEDWRQSLHASHRDPRNKNPSSDDESTSSVELATRPRAAVGLLSLMTRSQRRQPMQSFPHDLLDSPSLMMRDRNADNIAQSANSERSSQPGTQPGSVASSDAGSRVGSVFSTGNTTICSSCLSSWGGSPFPSRRSLLAHQSGNRMGVALPSQKAQGSGVVIVKEGSTRRERWPPTSHPVTNRDEMTAGTAENAAAFGTGNPDIWHPEGGANSNPATRTNAQDVESRPEQSDDSPENLRDAHSNFCAW